MQRDRRTHSADLLSRAGRGRTTLTVAVLKLHSQQRTRARAT